MLWIMYNTYFLEYLSSLSRKYKLGTRSGGGGRIIRLFSASSRLSPIRETNKRAWDNSIGKPLLLRREQTVSLSQEKREYSFSINESFINLLEYKEFSCVLSKTLVFRRSS